MQYSLTVTRWAGISDPEMEKCADVCQRCAESCAQMAGAHAHVR